MNTVLNCVINGAMLSLPLNAAVWLALRLLPRRSLSAAARYLIWWAALVSTVALPAMYRPPHVPPRPVSRTIAAVRFEVPVFVAPAAPAGFHPLQPPGFPLRVAIGNWTRWIAVAWAASALLMLARLILSCFTLLRRKRASEPIQLAIPLPRRARAMLSSEIPAPIAAGFLRPAILLPARFLDQLTPDQIEQIVLHESAHLARRDDCSLLFQRTIEAAFALHPAVRFIARQLDLEREIACDDRVVQATRQPASYAACLTRVAEISGPISFAAAFSQNRSQLSRRVDILLDHPLLEHARTIPARLLKTRLAFVALLLIALVWTLSKTPALLAFSTALPAPLAAQVKSEPAPAQAAAEPSEPQPVRPPAAEPAPQARLRAKLADTLFIGDAPSALEVTAALEVIAMDWRSLKPETLDALEEIEKTPGTYVQYIQPSDSFNWQLAAERGIKRLRQSGKLLPRILLLIGAWDPSAIPAPQDVKIVVAAESDLYPGPEAKLRSYVTAALDANQELLSMARKKIIADWKARRQTPGRPVASPVMLPLNRPAHPGFYSGDSPCFDQPGELISTPSGPRCY